LAGFANCGRASSPLVLFVRVPIQLLIVPFRVDLVQSGELCDSSVLVDFENWWAEQFHSVIIK